MYVCWKITRKPCRSTLDGLSVGLLVGDSDVTVDVIQVGANRGCTYIEPINVGKPAPFLLDYIIAKHK